MTRPARTAVLVTTAAAIFLGALAGCASRPKPATTASKPGPARTGAYYKDDGPAASTPGDLDQIPDAQPREEPLHRFANRPYNVFGVDYAPMTTLSPLRQRGVASWYGRKFHGQKTAIGETYDMFAMTAAHPTAPLPSYARITNPRTSRSVVVRINDRGPFHSGRIVDLSYAAAHRIGLAQGGSAPVELELLLPPYSVVTNAVPARSPPPRVDPVPSMMAQSPDALPTPATAQREFYVQLGAFGNFANAQAFQQHMGAELSLLPRVQQVDSLFRVRLGPFSTHAEAVAARDRAQSLFSTTLPITSNVDR